MTTKNGFVACDKSAQPCKWKEHQFPSWLDNCPSQQTTLVYGTIFSQTMTLDKLTPPQKTGLHFKLLKKCFKRWFVYKLMLYLKVKSLIVSLKFVLKGYMKGANIKTA